MSNVERAWLVALCAGLAATAACGGGSKHAADGGSPDAASGTSGSGGRGTGGTGSGRGMTMSGGNGAGGMMSVAGMMSAGGSGAAGTSAAGTGAAGGGGAGGSGAGGEGMSGAGGAAGTNAGSGGTGASGSGGTSAGSGGVGGGGSGGSGGSGGTSGSGGSSGTGAAGTGSGGGGAGGTGGNSGGGTGGTDNSMDAGTEEDAGTVVISVPLSLNVAPDQNRHAISPLIYGINGAAAANASGAKLVRLGGLFASGYNWEINATNLADTSMPGNPPPQVNQPLGSGSLPGAAAAEALAVAQANGGLAMLSVAMGDYVAADTLPGNVLSDTNYLSTRFVPNYAKKNATFLTMPDTGDNAVYQDEFVNWVMSQTQLVSAPVVFSLDNQPGIWELDHPAFHPTKVTYDELVQLAIEYSGAIKAVWPGASVSGPVPYGWYEYVSLQNSPDADTKGDFLNYYLDHLAAADTGTRLLDYLDVHWWSEVYADGHRITEDDAISPAQVDARLAAPRSLWDSSYAEPTYIEAQVNGVDGSNVDLIHRMKNKISQHYPGTKLAISAWYYGGGNHVSGAIATADVLGIFGREDVGLAALELPGGPSVYTLAAFQVFLNYDGSGAHFGDTSVAATSDDVEGSSVYASVNSAAGTEIVIVALNKRSSTRNANLHIDGANNYSSCDLYQLTSSGPALVAAGTIGSDGNNGFAFDMPPMSVMVLVPHP